MYRTKVVFISACVFITILFICLTDSDDASVGNEEMNRIPKDGIELSLYYTID